MPRGEFTLRRWPDDGPLSKESVIGGFIPRADPTDLKSKRQKRAIKEVEILRPVTKRLNRGNDG